MSYVIRVSFLGALILYRFVSKCELWCRSQTWLGSGIAVSCGVGHRHGLDQALLRLWCRTAAIAPIRLLAWVLVCCRCDPKKTKDRKKKKGFEAVFHQSRDTIIPETMKAD